jgi:urea transport system permease protein
MADHLPYRLRDVALVRRVSRLSWPATVSWTNDAAPAIGLFLLVLAVPYAFGLELINTATLSQLGRYCCLAVMAIGLDLVWGYTGVLSLCQAMFFTIGGYACGMYLAMHGPLDGAGIPRALFVVSSEVSGMVLPWFWRPFESFGFSLAMVAAVPGILAFVFGYVAFRSRIRGVYFSIITQAATVAMFLLFCRNDLKLCGTNGLTNFTHVLGWDLSSPATKLGLYLVSVATLVACAALALWLTRSRFGRLLVAIRDSESRLRFAGYQPVWFKTAVFSLGAVLAGVAGALYTPQTGIITPANMIASESIWVVVWVAVGGRGTIVGAVLGCLLIKLLESKLTTIMPNGWMYVIGTAFVLVVLYMPDGLVGQWRKLRGRALGMAL